MARPRRAAGVVGTIVDPPDGSHLGTEKAEGCSPLCSVASALLCLCSRARGLPEPAHEFRLCIAAKPGFAMPGPVRSFLAATAVS